MSIFSGWAMSGSYDSLWKKVEQAGEKDLPQDQLSVLEQIAAKATKERQYGQLLKAELKQAQVKTQVSPDSLLGAVERLEQRAQEIKDVVLKTVYQTAVYRICNDNPGLEKKAEKPELTADLCRQLAALKATDYKPFVVKGADSHFFGHDLLSVIGYELKDFKPLHDYYQQQGNREATCLTALEMIRHSDAADKLRAAQLDSLLNEYQDLSEAGEIAIQRYHMLKFDDAATAADKYNFLVNAISRWSSWQRINELRNAQLELTNPKYEVNHDQRIWMSNQKASLELKNVRNLKELSLTIYPVNANGDAELNPQFEKGYNKIKPLLGKPVQQLKHAFSEKPVYEVFNDSMEVPALPTGVYMLEFKSPSTEVQRRVLFVTDVYTIAESQPNGNMRFVVVSARTGQPIPNAHLRIREYVSYNKYNYTNVRVNAQGEYLMKEGSNKRCEVYAWTENDKAYPWMNTAHHYYFYDNKGVNDITSIYTDRAIYRPGQTVHAAAILYSVTNGFEQQALSNKDVEFILRDANNKVVKEIETTTDNYGTATADFTLPVSGLTGFFSLEVNNSQRHTFRVEEYKRPTFEVKFDEVKQDYKAGDTLQLKGKALSYAGVPVQDATVNYRVVRRMAFWWWGYSRYWSEGYIGTTTDDDEVSEGTVTTDADGCFTTEVPLIMPESRNPMFYNFIVTADVSDQAGETRTGQLSVPLGNRKTALSIDVEAKVLAESKPTINFHLRNAAGNDIEATVRYRIDGGEWQQTPTNKPVALKGKTLRSGSHHVEAATINDASAEDAATAERDFIVFSLDDKRPAAQTPDWFYLSASQFPNDGTPVTLQAGSSDADVHIVYSIFAGEKLIETGATDVSNGLINRKLTYKENYGNGLLFNFAWVKNGRCYTHTESLRRPLPNKNLKLSWKTFRDRLIPGQQEEWMLTIQKPDGTPADAQLMATLYDKSLDQLTRHQWSLFPYSYLPLPNTSWTFASDYGIHIGAQMDWKRHAVYNLYFSKFDEGVFPNYRRISIRGYGRHNVLRSARAVADDMKVYDVVEEDFAVEGNAPALYEMEVVGYATQKKELATGAVMNADEADDEAGQQEMQMRENLQETAFFYPQLTCDENGQVALKFTLPESLTTWRFMGIAHTTDMMHGDITGETVARKDVMIQPNLPRFLRQNDEAVIAARIFNTGEKMVNGKATLQLLNAETEAIVYERQQTVTLQPGSTTPVEFQCAMSQIQCPLLIARVMIEGGGFADGEQHYLPLLPNAERITVSRPITQNEPGTVSIDLQQLIPTTASDAKVTLEYTNDPTWFMIQALPAVGTPNDQNAISLAAAYYANALGKLLIDRMPTAKKVFHLWQQERGQETSLMSALEKNQELKNLVLSETPWVMDADLEDEQKQRLADFFDDNLMQNRLTTTLEKLSHLQKPDGSWGWWPEMQGSQYVTIAVSEMLVRLGTFVKQSTRPTGPASAYTNQLSNAFRYMGNEIVEEVEWMKKQERKGFKQSFPSHMDLRWLYLCALDGRELPKKVAEANDYLIALLKKEIKQQTLYEKALTAVVLENKNPQLSQEYAKSLKQYTVYREDMGRYYDTPRAGYSWFDYRIPTQTIAIEALQRITPNDRETISQMQRWLLHQKRTQAWDTPINSVNAIHAFSLNPKEPTQPKESNQPKEPTLITLDNKPLSLPEATAALGYVKTVLPKTDGTVAFQKTSEGTSWGAVYAQFTQSARDVQDQQQSGLTIEREILPGQGRRVTVCITITADRDYDFIQVIDRRAASMEPVNQLSGYRDGSYCTPRDNMTCYFFDRLSKGKHVIESEYYIDRAGTYETGTCSVECAYSPEFRAVTKGVTIKNDK